MSNEQWLNDLFNQPLDAVSDQEVPVLEDSQIGSAQESQTLTLEKGLQELEMIVKILEQKDLSLEKALSLFKEGVGLVQYCSNVLDLAEKQMELLLEGPDGELQLRPTSFDREG